ncbi:hypothetical protein E2C01_035069 [Portunus trituberculatus]|uniref:Uncharacterized protein n=1 Tax=Portunus trituberculatus TaxID=210409 RepID=A0A5B7F7G1_PORTR|nr:hypothetical protein [Portunus trituberculatus]
MLWSALSEADVEGPAVAGSACLTGLKKEDMEEGPAIEPSAADVEGPAVAGLAASRFFNTVQTVNWARPKLQLTPDILSPCSFLFKIYNFTSNVRVRQTPQSESSTSQERPRRQQSSSQRPRLIPRTRATERVRDRIIRKRKEKRKKRRLNRKRKFQAYVKDAEKHSAKEKKWAKSYGGSSEKHSRRLEPASEAPWASRLVAVESDLAAMKVSIGQLSAVLLPLASGSAFSGFADGGASVRPSPRLVPDVEEPRSPLGSGSLVVASGSSGASLSVSPLPGLAPGVSGGQGPSVLSPAPELVVRRVSLCAALRSAPPLVASGVPSPTVPGPSMEFSGLSGVSICAAPLSSLAL